MGRQPPRIDFTPFEGRYPRVFDLLRKRGWTSSRFVEFPDIDRDATGAPRGEVLLNDFAEALLHSFYGLEIEAKNSWGNRRVLFGFDERLQKVMLNDYLQNMDGFSGFTFPYPILAWDTMTGFATERGDAFAIDDFYQVYVRATDPFRLTERALFNEKGVGLESGYLERRNMPQDYWHLVWNRPLDYHLPQYSVYALVDGGNTEYVLQCIEHPQLFQVIVTQISEAGQTLHVKYRRNDSAMQIPIATGLIVHKLLDEFFEGTYRDRIQRIELIDEQTAKVIVARWPQNAP